MKLEAEERKAEWKERRLKMTLSLSESARRKNMAERSESIKKG